MAQAARLPRIIRSRIDHKNPPNLAPAGREHPKVFPAGGREYLKKAATMARGYMSGLGSTS